MMPYGMPSDHRFDTSWNSSHWLHDLVRNYGYSISTSRMLARFQDSYLVNYLGKKTNYPFHSSPLPNLFWLSWDITCNTKKDMQIIPSANLEKKKKKTKLSITMQIIHDSKLLIHREPKQKLRHLFVCLWQFVSVVFLVIWVTLCFFKPFCFFWLSFLILKGHVFSFKFFRPVLILCFIATFWSVSVFSLPFFGLGHCH